MTQGKRLFDVLLAIALSLLFGPVLLILLAIMLIAQGRPLFFVSTRMKTPDQAFCLYKLRTMRIGEHVETGVSGGDKAGRITGFGRFLRRSRLDEIPQLWNVLKGDMSFVGPRPPLRQYVVRFPRLYKQVLRSRPGITGLATLHYHQFEERMLQACKTASETDETYCRRAIPRKARLDLMYQNKRSVCFDMQLILETVAKLWPGFQR